MVFVTGLSQGSIVVTFSIVFLSNSTLNISTVATELMQSLQKSKEFTIDPNSITIRGKSSQLWKLYYPLRVFLENLLFLIRKDSKQNRCQRLRTLQLSDEPSRNIFKASLLKY